MPLNEIFRSTDCLLRKIRLSRDKDISELLECLLAYTNTWVASIAPPTQDVKVHICNPSTWGDRGRSIGKEPTEVCLMSFGLAWDTWDKKEGREGGRAGKGGKIYSWLNTIFNARNCSTCCEMLIMSSHGAHILTKGDWQPPIKDWRH